MPRRGVVLRTPMLMNRFALSLPLPPYNVCGIFLCYQSVVRYPACSVRTTKSRSENELGASLRRYTSSSPFSSMSAIPNLPLDTPGLHRNGTKSGIGKTPFKLNDSPIENQRPLKVVVIGAGYSGIYCGIRIPERLRNVELVIYEKNAGVGGTWFENR